MMLRHLDAREAADAVENGITAKSKVRTPDIGGSARTKDLGEAIALAVSDAK
jgi:isocitrate/isopropylmalate dehydrogenase